MRKPVRLLTLGIVLLLCGTVQAQVSTSTPKRNLFSKVYHWSGHHKRFLLMEGAALGAAGIHAYGLHHCRRVNGPEPCDLHYGAAWANFGIVTGLNLIVSPSVAEGCWKDEHGKFCNIFAYGGSAAQAGWGIRESRIKAHYF